MYWDKEIRVWELPWALCAAFKKWRHCYCKTFFYLSSYYNSKQRSTESNPLCRFNWDSDVIWKSFPHGHGTGHWGLSQSRFCSAINSASCVTPDKQALLSLFPRTLDKIILEICFSPRILCPRDLYYSKTKGPHCENLSKWWVYSPLPRLGQAFIFPEWDHLINKKSKE